MQQDPNAAPKPAMTPPATPPSTMPAMPQVGAAAPMAPINPAMSVPTGGPNVNRMPNGPSLAPAMPQAAAPGAAPGAMPATQSFGPGNDLRGTQINPTTDPRLAATQGNVDSVANKLANGPDRFQIAQDRFKTYADQTDPAFQASIRSATQHAAANGAVGSGQLGTDYGNLALQHTRDLANERSGLFSNALEGTIGDTRANAGILSGMEGQQYGEGAANRNELRGERGYQNGMENQAYTRGVQGLELGDQLTNSAFGRGLATSQFGSQGNPGATQLGLAGMYGQQASDAGSSVGSLLQAGQQNSILNSIYGQQGQPSQSGGGTLMNAMNPQTLGNIGKVF